MVRPKIDYKDKVFSLVSDEWLTTNQIKSKGILEGMPKSWITYYYPSYSSLITGLDSIEYQL